MGKNYNIVSYYAPDDVVEILKRLGNRSEYITAAIRAFEGTDMTETPKQTPIAPKPKQPKASKWHPNLESAWDYYRDKTGHTRTLTEQRKNKLNSRLNELGPETLKRAMDYLLSSPFHNGDNDRKWKWDIDFLIRNTEQVEKFADLYQEAPKKKTLAEMFDEQ